jgi:hypothetical protein
MAESARALRFAELQALRLTDPRQLISMYCRITGQTETSQLPAHASFAAMIDTIIEHEVPVAQLDRECDNASP